MRARKWLGGCAAVAALVAPGFWVALRAAPAAAPAGASRAAAPSTAPSPLAGTASCSARGCHGAADPGPTPGVRQNEFRLWLARDKHADAYRALHGDLAAAIAGKLYGEGRPAWKEGACLACHANPLAASGASDFLKEEQQSGVGCEACHGAAAGWVAEHTSDKWRGYSAQERRDRGMTPVDEPVEAAQTCVGCHIGAAADAEHGLPRRDMNHDMIAAGHPRLSFEFGAFLANLPPHWDEAEQAKKRDACFDGKAWAVGQVVSAQAALALLADRAADRTGTRPWPEYAEYDCFACHHDLGEPSWRQKRGYPGRTAGALPWGGWYFTMPRLLAVKPPFGDAKDPSVPKELDNLRKVMSTPLQKGSRDKAVTQAGALADKLAALRDKATGAGCRPEDMRKLLAALAAEDPDAPPPDWDGAEQTYLAAVALQAHGDDGSRKTLIELARKRANPPGFGSPRGFRPDEFLSELRQGLKRPGE